MRLGDHLEQGLRNTASRVKGYTWVVKQVREVRCLEGLHPALPGDGVSLVALFPAGNCIEVAFVSHEGVYHVYDLLTPIVVEILLSLEEVVAHEYVQGDVSAWLGYVELVKLLKHFENSGLPGRSQFDLA